MKILVTGGAGYIGSHTILALKKRKHEVSLLDNFSVGPKSNLEILQVPYYDVDVLDTEQLSHILHDEQFRAIIHFAGSAYVGESFDQPDFYYQNNVLAAFSLLQAVQNMPIPAKIIFSSTCATYGIPSSLPITESTPQHPISPYGRTKLVVEWMLEDFYQRYNIPYTILRYFNAAGCHPQGFLGENHDPEPHLIPRMISSALEGTPIVINGKELPTPDGTCIRDYIHVCDLAMAHTLCVEHANTQPQRFNLGLGKGYSILELHSKLQELIGKDLEIQWNSPRTGDPPILVANAEKFKETLHWTPQYSIDDILKTALSWFIKRK